VWLFKLHNYYIVLEPISSTVESIPIYKLSRGFETGSIKEYFDKKTLLTGNNYYN